MAAVLYTAAFKTIVMDNIQKWLDTFPAQEEIKQKDGANYIPYEVIIGKLYKLCGHKWGAYNFHETYVSIGRRVLVTGHVEVEVNYMIGEDKIHRRLSGGANFILTKASNPHPTATVKSLAIMNAVKPLGKQFGWALNPENEEEKTQFLPVVKVERQEPTTEQERLKALIYQCETIEKLAEFKLLATAKGLTKEYTKKLKEFSK